MNASDRFRGLQQSFGNGAQPLMQKSAERFATAARGNQGVPENEMSATLAATARDVRLKKVTAIQQALAAGTYHVSDLEVAASLIDHMLEA